jgi:hypothetical protein
MGATTWLSCLLPTCPLVWTNVPGGASIIQYNAQGYPGTMTPLDPEANSMAANVFSNGQCLKCPLTLELTLGACGLHSLYKSTVIHSF